jgi:hypothetical protein
MADFIQNVGDHPPAGCSSAKDTDPHFDVTATGKDTRISSKAPNRLIKATLKPDAVYNDGKGDPGPNFGKIPHVRY